MSHSTEASASENRLAAFVAELATSAERLQAYRADAEAAMEAARLGMEEKAVLRSGDWHSICEFLGEPDVRPVSTSQGGGLGNEGG